MNWRNDFKAVAATAEEWADWKATHRGQSPIGMRRIECGACGKRIWMSGLGVGSHRRFCTGTGLTFGDQYAAEGAGKSMVQALAEKNGRS